MSTEYVWRTELIYNKLEQGVDVLEVHKDFEYVNTLRVQRIYPTLS